MRGLGATMAGWTLLAVLWALLWRPPEDAVFPALPEFRSVAGVLTATLEARPGRQRLGAVTIETQTYNGSYAGPVLRVRPGDLMRITLVNHLSEPTNLHFHGLQTSPRGNSDNVHLTVEPGRSLLYEVRVPPDQPPGLYWYHAHPHGRSEAQVMAGLGGALVVEGEPPVLASLRQRLFVLKDDAITPGGGGYAEDELHNLVQTIDGAVQVDLTMRPGETQLWRFSNQSADHYFHLSVEGHRFRIIARDGIPSRAEEPTEMLDIMPASRLEVLVDGGAPGPHALVSHRILTGSGAARTTTRRLGTVWVAGTPARPLPPQAALDDSADLRSAVVNQRRRFSFSQKNDDEHFFIDGREFDPLRVDVRVPLGHVEEWTVRNDSDDFHEFHIHQLPFQVVAIDGVAQPFTGLVDTVRLPERGQVTIRLAFTSPLIVGRFMFHCHILSHEDHGMMAQIEVYDPAATLSPSADICRAPRR